MRAMMMKMRGRVMSDGVREREEQRERSVKLGGIEEDSREKRAKRKRKAKASITKVMCTEMRDRKKEGTGSDAKFPAIVCVSVSAFLPR